MHKCDVCVVYAYVMCVVCIFVCVAVWFMWVHVMYVVCVSVCEVPVWFMCVNGISVCSLCVWGGVKGVCTVVCGVCIHIVRGKERGRPEHMAPEFLKLCCA